MTGTSQTGSAPWLLLCTPPACQYPEHRGQPVSAVAESSAAVLNPPAAKALHLEQRSSSGAAWGAGSPTVFSSEERRCSHDCQVRQSRVFAHISLPARGQAFRVRYSREAWNPRFNATFRILMSKAADTVVLAMLGLLPAKYSELHPR